MTERKYWTICSINNKLKVKKSGTYAEAMNNLKEMEKLYNVSPLKDECTIIKGDLYLPKWMDEDYKEPE
jgi:hypothetical protein